MIKANETTQTHMSLVASVFKACGFAAKIKGSRVEISLRKRNVYKWQVEMLIDNEELPIETGQLVYACGNVYIKFNGYC